MGYWESVRAVTGMNGAYPWLLLASVLVALGLGAMVPDTRFRLRAAISLVLFSLPGILVCVSLRRNGVSESWAVYRWTHFAAMMCLAIGVINIAGVLLFRVLLAAIRLQPSPILRDILLAVVYIIVALTLLRRHEVDLAGIVATSAVVTAVIGFSLQDTLGNIMGGMALQMERSLTAGDWVRIGDVEGIIREIRWRQTSIETRNWDTVIIPNSVLMKSQVIVLGRRFGKPKQHRMWVYFNVDFRHAPADVIAAVEAALQAKQIPNVATDPAPNCILYDFKDSYGYYAVRYWLIDFSRDDPTSSEIRTRIFVALQRAGMSVSIPAQSVFMTLDSHSRKDRKHHEEVEKRVSALNGVKLLQPLNDDERHQLAGQLGVAPFRNGEIITRQGNVAHHLYIMTRGDASVSVSVDGAPPKQIATLHAGDVFGEMGLMTGEPRHATITAVTDVLCYRLDKPALEDILRRRPEMAEAISHLLAERKVQLDAITEGLNEEAVRLRMTHTHVDLLDRIRQFFTLT